MKKILTLVTIFAFTATMSIACKRINKDTDDNKQEMIEIEETVITEEVENSDFEDITDDNTNPDVVIEEMEVIEVLPADGANNDEVDDTNE